MTKSSIVFLVILTLGCTWSYYYQSYYQPYQPKVVVRHHYPAYHSPTPYVGSAPVPRSPYPNTYAAQSPYQVYSYQTPNNIPYRHAPSYQPIYQTSHQSYHQPYAPSPLSPSYQHGYDHTSAKQSIFTRIKPFLFGTSPKSHPHHPFFPNHHHPHMYYPKKGFHNNQHQHHQHHLQHQMHHMHHMQEMQHKSCSCSLHVGHLTVYKHTDMRASYSCHDLKECNAFCTNLFSSEDLRAQTRTDACLMLGKDITVPWFRRDHACSPHGVHNDTKLSVDLCCKNLQPC